MDSICAPFKLAFILFNLTAALQEIDHDYSIHIHENVHEHSCHPQRNKELYRKLGNNLLSSHSYT